MAFKEPTPFCFAAYPEASLGPAWYERSKGWLYLYKEKEAVTSSKCSVRQNACPY